MEEKRGQTMRETLEEARAEREMLEKKMKRTGLMFGIIGGLIALCLVILLVLTVIGKKKSAMEAAALAEEEAAIAEEEPIPQEEIKQVISAEAIKEDPNRVTLTAVGDNLLHAPLYEQAFARTGGNGYDFGRLYEDVAPFVQQHDLNWVNIETIMTDELGPTSYPQFASPGDSARKLIELGWNVFSLSSNHTYDWGDNGVYSTMKFWDSMPDDVITCGIWRNFDDIPIIEAKGHKVAFLTYTYGCTLGSSGAYGTVIFLKQEDLIKKQIEAAREQADCVVVGCHWGTEYQLTPSSGQREMAQEIADFGADLIIGCHPHVPQDYEILHTEDGRDVFCIYSLGNFVSAQQNSDPMLELMLECTLFFEEDENGEEKVTIENPRLIPLINVYGPGMTDVHVEFMKDYAPSEASEHGVRYYDPSFTYDYALQTLKRTVGADCLVLPTEKDQENAEKRKEEKLAEAERARTEEEAKAANAVKDFLALEPDTEITLEDIPVDNWSVFELPIEEGDAVFERINGKSYRENPDIALSDLSYLRIPHYDYDHKIRLGEMIVNAEVGTRVLSIFHRLFELEYEIESMRLVDDFWTGEGASSDLASIRANNTSAFCYRKITDGTELSNHAFGKAIDLNPAQNPYILYKNGVPYDTDPEDEPYFDRTTGNEHYILHGDACYTIFQNYGFAWGGDWTNPVDYQHFEYVD